MLCVRSVVIFFQESNPKYFGRTAFYYLNSDGRRGILNLHVLRLIFNFLPFRLARAQ